MEAAAPLYSNLLPELLLALVGQTGDVYVAEGSLDAGKTQIRLSDDIDWVSAADREILNTLSRLGAHYADLSASLDQACAADSLYSRALANGVSELLDVYRLAVLQVEQHLLHYPAPPLLTLQHFLAEFEVLLPEVHQVVNEVAAKRLSGSQVMGLLAVKARSGVPAVQSCASRLLWHCYQVMFKQLESWLVHGVLLDSAGEFFIQRTPAAAAAAAAAAREAYGISIGVAPGSTQASPHPSPSRMAPGPARLPNEWDPLEWHSGFQVSVASLPPGVSLTTADTILFIGKAVRVLKQPIAASSAVVSSQAVAANAELLAVCEALHELQQREQFRAADLDQLVERMRGAVAGLLWNLVLHRSDLLGNLTSMRNYFLLGRGDFYQQFLDEAQQLLQAPPKFSTAESEVALLFQQASLKTTAEADPFFSHWHLRWGVQEVAAAPAASGELGDGGEGSSGGGVAFNALSWHPSNTANVTVPALDGWDGLFLESTVDWPLQLLFPPEVLSKYGAVWQYLFRLRRVQLALEGAWAELQALQHPGGSGSAAARAAGEARLPPALRVQLWQLRQRMSHFIHNLTMYTQVDVIDARFVQLREAIGAARDFMEADAAHRAYVDSLVTQTFLDLRQLMQIVEAIFAACTRLCSLVKELAAGNVDEEAALGQLKEVGRTYRLRLGTLLTFLQSNKLQSANRAPAVRQLILRLNFNDFLGQDVLTAALNPLT